MDNYVNLLGSNIDVENWDPSQNFPPTGQQPQHSPMVGEQPSAEVGGSSRPNNKRSKNFNTAEDQMLVSAWLNTTLDAITGVEQHRDSYWARIHQYFHENKNFPSDQNQNSLNNCWGTIQEQVNKFCGYYEQILNGPQSGMVVQDYITQAFTLYKSAEKKTFSLMHCWEILHHHPKWNDRLFQKRQKAHVDPLVRPSASTNSSEFHYSPDINTSDPLVRPPGKKVEKAKCPRGNTSSCSSESSPVVIALNNMWSEKKEMSAQSREERNDRLVEVISLEKERLKVEKRKLDIETHEREERIMNMDLSAMDGPRKTYYLRLQQEIIKAHMD
ncbi:hypothetical protein OsJ_31505 [Oryza sativa Japonica Group]|uniref:No apical meristem-associated C-terminal domain-containing protein n=1 Tax=Oryza sativa subsp. japonica TaxID=39947 RepID=A3C4Q1_ORYSJ|nr:hypothetical protein OsJ_31505 [Oryza sativa Japonica Group]